MFFDNIRDWENWKRNPAIKNIDIVKNIQKENNIESKDEYIFLKFWSHVDIKDNIEECWSWTGCTNATRGYGVFKLDGNTVSVHRLAYDFTKGKIDEMFQVQHTCNNRICCNPNHLKLGTPSENTRYMIKCGREERGEYRYNAKITEEDVREIHMLHKKCPGLKQWEIAEMFGIYKGHVGEILRGEQWHHIYKEFH